MTYRTFARLLLVAGICLTFPASLQAQKQTPALHLAGPPMVLRQQQIDISLPAAPHAPASTPSANAPLREVSVAISRDPVTLYVYNAGMIVQQHVLDALMDGPSTALNYGNQPVILTKMPSLTDGDAVVRQATVVSGTRIVGPSGDILIYTGKITVMPQMVVTFTQINGVRWSDGAAVTSQDWTFGHDVGCSPDTNTDQTACWTTADYQAVGPLSVRWTGLPGYLTPGYATRYWQLLPYHVLSTTTPALIQSGSYGRNPLGWGPFKLTEWAADHITLDRNPYYWRAGYPRLDRVTFRWYPNGAALRAAIMRGEVQVVTWDTTGQLDTQDVLTWQAQGVIRVLTSPSLNWEHLDFDLLPSDGRYAFFADRQVRQAVAYAVDRGRIISETMFGLATPANAYVPSSSWAYTTSLHTYPYSPTLAASLLTAAGWVDTNNDGIREKGGRPFVITHTVTTAAYRQTIGHILQQNLRAVGISMTLNATSQAFGDFNSRQYDTGEFMWSNGPTPPCDLFLSSNIPGDWNGWNGSNNVVYSNPVFDTLCQNALSTLDPAQYTLDQQRAIISITEDVPVLPLYFSDKLVAAAPYINPAPGVDTTDYSELWNVWAWDIQSQTTVTSGVRASITCGGELTATFPVGTFASTTIITCTPELPGTPPAGLSGVGRAFDLQAVSANTGQPVQPSSPYTITVSYADPAVQSGPIQENTLALYWWNGSQWVKETSSVVNAVANTVTATPNHMSLFALLGVTHRAFLPIVRLLE
jgi:peptide/nickel transport system substrate-binding protein